MKAKMSLVELIGYANELIAINKIKSVYFVRMRINISR